jgi:hypothetical protein
LILPLLLLLFWRASIPRWQTGVVVLGVLLAFGLSVGWNSLALSGSHFDTGGEQSVGRQLELILASPLAFLTTFIQGNLTRLGGFYQDWVGVYGHWVGPGWFHPGRAAQTGFLARAALSHRGCFPGGGGCDRDALFRRELHPRRPGLPGPAGALL